MLEFWTQQEFPFEYMYTLFIICIIIFYRKARAGELESHSGLEALARLTEINVDQVGVNGAKNFFEAKIEELAKSNKFHNEILQEQEEKRREAEERAIRRQKFNEKAAFFRQ